MCWPPQERIAAGLPLDAYCYSSLVAMAAQPQGGGPEEVKALFRRAVQGGVLNTVLANTVSHALLQVEDYEVRGYTCISIWLRL